MIDKLVLHNIFCKKFFCAIKMLSQVAVILSGCGAFDGTDIHEASAVCVALTRLGKKPVFYAPQKNMYHEINHTTGQQSSETKRNVLIESGRIARGNVLKLNVSVVLLI